MPKKKDSSRRSSTADTATRSVNLSLTKRARTGSDDTPPSSKIKFDTGTDCVPPSKNGGTGSDDTPL